MEPLLPTDKSRDYAFWKDYPGIVWSNPNASDAIMIANTLLQRRESVVVAIARHFGPEKLQREWLRLKNEAPSFPEILKTINGSRQKLDTLIDSLAKENHA